MTKCLSFLFLMGFLVAASPRVHFVDVGDGVRIEVLEWNGTGRPVVLLAGSGNTAHVFEDFAPKLAGCCHVYAITRRGYGASSKPERGYSVPELAEDDWRVIEALKIEKPVMVGHSMAGSELSYLGQKLSPAIAALIYLDANADPMDFPWSNAEYREVVTRLMKGTPAPPAATSADRASVEAYQSYQIRNEGFSFPVAEIRNIYEIQPDGSVGPSRTPPFVRREIDRGSIQKDYGGIKVPVLALFAVQRRPAEKWKDKPADEQERRDSERAYELEMQFISRWQGNLKRAVPDAKIVDLPGAKHYLFLSNEPEVMRELLPFLGSLRP